MDYSRQPIGRLFRGPLLHTPQGIVLLISIAIYLLGAALFAFFDVPTPFDWSVDKSVTVFIVWPFMLFMLFIKQNLPEFLPSRSGAIWQAFYAIAPFVFISLGKLSSVD